MTVANILYHTVTARGPAENARGKHYSKVYHELAGEEMGYTRKP